MVKRFGLILMVFMVAMFMMAGSARAALIGVDLLTAYPDIIFDNKGIIAYDADTDQFVLDADDLQIVYSDGTTDPLIGTGIVDMNITLTVDENGDLVSGTMTETLISGFVTIAGVTYTYNGTGIVLLAGDVTAFGWGEGSDLGDFDFLVNNVTGGLVDQGIWVSDLTGITAIASEGVGTWDGTWTSDFNLVKIKGNKAPVPIPTTMLLLGTGLMGLVGFGRKRLLKT